MRINEIFVDRDLSGDRVEYVELTGPVGEPLSGLFLRLLGPDAGVLEDVAVTANDAGVIGATGTWVVGGISANGRVDQTYSVNTWGMDNTSGGVELVKRQDGGTELLDTVGYGALQTREGAPLTLPTSAANSLGRKPGSTDTDVNTADFCVQAQSGGAANTTCL